MKDRKKDHIHLTDKARVPSSELDHRFFYEPILSGHPKEDEDISLSFLGKELLAPIWISSMTGGTWEAAKINRNLARATAEFGLGMALGSCRILLESPGFYPDFDWRGVIGEDRPFYANLGIAQVEQLLHRKEENRIFDLLDKLRADGLVVHVNPLQEWMQPEGDRFQSPPIETIAHLLQRTDFPIIVKEVGQGMGPDSLRHLMELPLAAIEFGAAGGTNFSKLEWLRKNREESSSTFENITLLGHDANQMTQFVNQILEEGKEKIACKSFIVSGGIRTFLDGYYFIQSLNAPSIYGVASSVLRYAREDYEDLRTYLSQQIQGLRMAQAFLRIKKSKTDG